MEASTAGCRPSVAPAWAAWPSGAAASAPAWSGRPVGAAARAPGDAEARAPGDAAARAPGAASARHHAWPGLWLPPSPWPAASAGKEGQRAEVLLHPWLAAWEVKNGRRLAVFAYGREGGTARSCVVRKEERRDGAINRHG